MKGCGCSENLPCGCCEGVEVLTPRSTANRPGLNALLYRVGTHASFFETMRARLSSDDFPALIRLRTRAKDDQSIALLDAASTMLDVLTFYQERIVNEGYLRTATERRSVLELARLVGYAPRPGVASSVYLAYTLDDNSQPIEIPAGARAQSTPEQDELPQSFETSEKLKARREWNDLRPRPTQPQVIVQNEIRMLEYIYFAGTDTKLKANDALLFVFGDKPENRVLIRVRNVTPDFDNKRTKVTFLTRPTPKPRPAEIGGLIKGLLTPPSLHPATSLQLRRKTSDVFNVTSDIRPRLLTRFFPKLADTLYPALSAATLSTDDSTLIGVFALRVAAPLFGNNALPITFKIQDREFVPQEPQEPVLQRDESAQRLFLDNAYDQILPSEKENPSYVAIDRGDDRGIRTFKVEQLRIGLRTAYRMSGKATDIVLDEKWWEPHVRDGDDFSTIRNTIVYAQSEQLTLADEPITEDVSGDRVELVSLYEELQAGRWIIVSGERTDIPDTSGIKASELAMLSGVEQNTRIPGDKIHTTLVLDNALAYTYKRETVKIYGNVVGATHGETRNEVLGSGDAAQTLQAFTLKQPPLTYVSAATTSGVESTLLVRVNDVEWSESDSLAGLNPQDRSYITKTDDEAKTTVIFGNGEQSSRLPTGIENVTAIFRNGIGKSGNVKAEQINLPLTKPLGVKEVINPLRSSGGADKETRDQARRNAPIAVMALDRLVSIRDYADFARTFAGVGKASAVRLSGGSRQLVHLTIAGADDIPIDINSGLHRNLSRALSKFGDPSRFLLIGMRELLALVIVANVRIHAEYSWDKVAVDLRTALLGAFSFERRELGQSVYLSEVISVMQGVRGVAYVDVDKLESISETEIENEELLEAKLSQLKSTTGPKMSVSARLADGSTGLPVLPAQLVYLLPRVPDTLILNQIDEVKK